MKYLIKFYRPVITSMNSVEKKNVFNFLSKFKQLNYLQNQQFLNHQHQFHQSLGLNQPAESYHQFRVRFDVKLQLLCIPSLKNNANNFNNIKATTFNVYNLYHKEETLLLIL